MRSEDASISVSVEKEEEWGEVNSNSSLTRVEKVKRPEEEQVGQINGSNQEVVTFLPGGRGGRGGGAGRTIAIS